jgi:translocation protein SEC72
MAQLQPQPPIRMAAPGQVGTPPQMMMPPPLDPLIQEVIDANFQPVNLKFGPPDNTVILSAFNSQEKDAENEMDFTGLNRLTKLLVTNPNIRCPPPPNVVSQKLSVAINNTKEEGNVCTRFTVPQTFGRLTNS